LQAFTFFFDIFKPEACARGQQQQQQQQQKPEQ